MMAGRGSEVFFLVLVLLVGVGARFHRLTLKVGGLGQLGWGMSVQLEAPPPLALQASSSPHWP